MSLTASGDVDSGRAPQTFEGSEENEQERVNRNFGELLQELRVAQTGVQILFAFLLILPFQPLYKDRDAWDDYLFTGTLLAAGSAALLLITPVPYHRLLFRRRLKDQIVRSTNRLAVAGLVAMMIAVTGALVLALRQVWPDGIAIGLSCAVLLTCATLWFVLPLARRRGLRPTSTGEVPALPARGGVSVASACEGPGTPNGRGRVGGKS